MTIAHVATATTTSDGASSMAATIPAGSVGDVIVAIIHTRRTAGIVTITAPGAYTQVSGGLVNRGSIRTGIYTRVATGSDAGTWSFSAACGAVAVVSRYSGVDNTTPVDVAAGTTNGNGSTATLPTRTTVTNGALLVGGVGWNGAVASLAPPGTMTERGDADGVFASNDLEANLADQIIAVAGATGTRAFTGAYSDDYTGLIFALRPAADAGPSPQLLRRAGYALY